MIGILAAAHGAGTHTASLMLAIRAVRRSFGVVMLRNGAMIPGAACGRVGGPSSSGKRSKQQ